ncbi:hypothetical protein CGL57_02125 [Edwardsiella anguillarum]|nr:hypothetical protein QY76_11025 [Edwardsiella sp. EA181011]RFT05135.1 hypothetical protein CGL57_02125 [Edwardsiella anguillarum]
MQRPRCYVVGAATNQGLKPFNKIDAGYYTYLTARKTTNLETERAMMKKGCAKAGFVAQPHAVKCVRLHSAAIGASQMTAPPRAGGMERAPLGLTQRGASLR